MNKHFLIKHLTSRCIIGMVLLLIFSGQLSAVDSAGRYLISGIGKDSCISFIDADDVGRSYYLTWLSGYITSHNYNSGNTYSIVNKKSVNDLETWLRDYCFVNSDDTFEQAAKSLIRSLEYFKKKNFYDN